MLTYCTHKYLSSQELEKMNEEHDQDQMRELIDLIQKTEIAKEEVLQHTGVSKVVLAQERKHLIRILTAAKTDREMLLNRIKV